VIWLGRILSSEHNYRVSLTSGVAMLKMLLFCLFMWLTKQCSVILMTLSLDNPSLVAGNVRIADRKWCIVIPCENRHSARSKLVWLTTVGLTLQPARPTRILPTLFLNLSIRLCMHLTNWPFAWSRVPLEKPIKNWPAFYGTRMFIIMFTRARHWFHIHMHTYICIYNVHIRGCSRSFRTES
jgi:hypothetical protein